MVKTKSLLKEQIASLDDKFKRALADYQNQEKRHEAQRSLLARFANEALLDKILPVLDDLERAQNHLKDAGLGHVLKTFHQVLASEGVTVIESDNTDFDPATMDCAEAVAGEKDKVVKTIAKGYRLFDKILRPAKVEVGDGTAPTEIPSLSRDHLNKYY
ncbi:MAG: nucleotide exchange factor GrpE [Patescibacteria group bacterium]